MLNTLQKKEQFPKNASIDITSHCNIDCIICSLKKEYHPKGDMNYKTFENIKPLLTRVENIELCCNAEPTLHPQLLTFLKEIKKISNAQVNFPTNGVLLNKKLITKLIRHGLDNLRFSLDGSTSQTYEDIRKGSSFRLVTKNIREVNLTKKKLRKENPHLALVFVAMKKNIQELPSLIELANKLEIKDVIVHGFECYSKNLVNEVLYFKSEGSEEFFNKAKEKAQNYGISLQLPELKIKKRYSCDRDKSCLITWNGDVCPCTPLSYTRPVYLREKIIQLRKLSFGNVNMISFEEIWRSKDYESFRKYSDRTKYKHCKDCLMNFGVIVPQE